MFILSQRYRDQYMIILVRISNRKMVSIINSPHSTIHSTILSLSNTPFSNARNPSTIDV